MPIIKNVHLISVQSWTYLDLVDVLSSAKRILIAFPVAGCQLRLEPFGASLDPPSLL